MSARKRKSTSKHITITPAKVIVLIILIIACLIMSRGMASDDTSHSAGAHPAGEYGNLLDVTTPASIPQTPKSYLGMDINFNPKAHIPNWVAWELTADETEGKEPRTNKFTSDQSVEGCAETWDYSYSGYDRGHMAPAGDMKWDKKAMEETFLLTNIVPQEKALNVGSWKNLEEKCRIWAKTIGPLYIVCGPVIDGRPKEYIGDTRVYVPRSFFKVILAPYASPAMGIGFIMPNGKVEGGMQKCAVSIDSVEALTGLDFFHTLPDQLENELESQNNFNLWSTIRSKR